MKPPAFRDGELTRRQFLRTTGVALTPAFVGLPAWSAAEAKPANFSFVLLGDLHYDKLEHHDFAWLDKNHPGDLSQIKNYSRITDDITPRLFATVRETVAHLHRSGQKPAFVLQVGDLVEGLCGNPELATRQNQEALAFVRDARLGAPFLFTKGNHDVTGDGAVEAYRSVFHPFLTAEARQISSHAAEVKRGFYDLETGNAHFAFFDAYDTESLAWFKALVARRTAEHLFVVVHPPVVPYGARATWHVYSSDRQKAQRAKFLDLLGRQRAFVLGGHIHKYNSLVREAGGGRFLQLAVSSIINEPEVKPKDLLSGLKDYTGDQVKVEPNHSPGTEPERRAVYDRERPFVRAFEYADLPGYAVVTVNGPRVEAKVYSGVSRQLWRTRPLDRIFAATG